MTPSWLWKMSFVDGVGRPPDGSALEKGSEETDRPVLSMSFRCAVFIPILLWEEFRSDFFMICLDSRSFD